MTPHEAKVRERHPDAPAFRGSQWWIFPGKAHNNPLASGETAEAAWANALRAIDPEDRTPLPDQAILDLG